MVEINVLRFTPLPSTVGAVQEMLESGAFRWKVTAFSKYVRNLWYRCFRKKFSLQIEENQEI